MERVIGAGVMPLVHAPDLGAVGGDGEVGEAQRDGGQGAGAGLRRHGHRVGGQRPWLLAAAGHAGAGQVQPLVAEAGEQQVVAAVSGRDGQVGLAAVLVHPGPGVPWLGEQHLRLAAGRGVDDRGTAVLVRPDLLPPDVPADDGREAEPQPGAGHLGGADRGRPFAVGHLGPGRRRRLGGGTQLGVAGRGRGGPVRGGGGESGSGRGGAVSSAVGGSGVGGRAVGGRRPGGFPRPGRLRRGGIPGRTGRSAMRRRMAPAAGPRELSRARLHPAQGPRGGGFPAAPHARRRTVRLSCQATCHARPAICHTHIVPYRASGPGADSGRIGHGFELRDDLGPARAPRPASWPSPVPRARSLPGRLP